MLLLSTQAFAAGEGGARSDREAFSAALSLFYSGDYARARDAFEGIFASYPGSPLSSKLSYWLGACSLKLGEYEVALGRFRTQIAMGGGFYAVHSRLLSGACLEALGRPEEAAAEYRRLLGDPAAAALAAETLFRLAGTRYAAGSYGEARDLYSRVLLEHPASGFVSDALFFLAESELALGRTGEAEKRYGTLVSLYPGSAYVGKAKLRIAEIAANDGRDEAALSTLSGPAAPAAQPDVASQALKLSGDILARGGDWDGARKAYSMALALSRDEAERQRINASMADVLEKEVLFAEAAAFLEEAGMGPVRNTAETASRKRAVLLARVGDERGAQNALERFLMGFPLSASREEMLLLLARLSDRLGDTELAHRSWNDFIGDFPRSTALPEGLYRRAMDSLSLGDEPAALEDLQRIGREFPSSEFYLPSLYAIGTVYAGRGEYSRALPVFRSILLHEPSALGQGSRAREERARQPAGADKDVPASALGRGADLSVKAVLASGICRFDLGLYSDALSDFDSLAKSDPTGIPALYAARSLYRMNKLEEASRRFSVLAGAAETAIAVEASWWLGWSGYRLGDYARARDAFISVVDRFPSDSRVPESLLRAAVCSVQLSDDAGAVRLLDRVLSVSRSGSSIREEALYQKGLALTRLSDAAGGRATLDLLAAEFPGSSLAAEAFFTLASQAMERGDAEKALSIFLFVHSGFPASPLSAQARYWAGEAALEAGKPEESAELFWTFIQEDSMGAFSAPATDGLERAVTLSGSAEAALRYVDAARASTAITPEVLSSLELAYAGLLMSTDPRGAAEVIDRVLSRKLPDPLLARALFLKARRDQLTGNTASARENFRTLASRADRVGAESMMEYARILEAAGQVKTAIDCFEAVGVRFSAFPDLAAMGLFDGAMLAREKGYTARAGELSARLKKEHPGSSWVRWLEVEFKAR